MAETKNKTTAKRKAPAKNTPQKKQPAKRPIRREVSGVVTLILALCVGVSYFSKEQAIFIDWCAVGLKGLLGYTYWIMLGILLLVSYILLFHRSRPVTLCVTSALLFPVFASALIHAAFCRETFDSSLGILKLLWSSGVTMGSGGVLGGSLAIGFHAVLGQAASIIIFAVLSVVALMAALRVTPAAMKRKWDERERLEYAAAEEAEQLRIQEKRVPPEKKPTSAVFPYDIPVDGQPLGAKPQLAAAEKKSGLFGGFFAAKPEHIQSPDEFLSGGERPAAAAAVPVVTQSAPVQSAPAAEKPVFDIAPPPAEKPAKKPAPFSKTEQEAEAERVAREIEAQEAGQELYQFPPITLLNEGKAPAAFGADAELRNNARRLSETLHSFGVEAAPGDVVRGPSVTRYEFMLEQGVKLSKVTNLADDIALALGASGVRIAPIQGKISVVGIEVPNKSVAMVTVREIIESKAFLGHKSPVCFAVGMDIGGNQIVGDIAKLPHILIAGTTGSGKSVCTNSLIVSLMYKSGPEDVKFIMVDPKMVELAPYNGIPHLLIPVVTDPKKAAGALQWAVFEMMKRYKLFSENGVKDLKSYNALAALDPKVEKLPSVVVVIDELADLMLAAAKEVEESICRVAQMGRAAGMHLVIATQRPSADVITGLMKANIPSRIAFAVASSLESRIILDTQGAEKLVGRGDMLYAPLGEGKPRRVQGCMITAEEIERVVQFVKQNSGEAQYSDEVMKKIDEAVAEKERGKAAVEEAAPADECDELLPAAVEVILETGQASVSMLQRRLKLGYSRAARLVDQMEERGIVGPFEGSKPRQLLITRAQWQELQMAGKTTAGEPFGDALAPSSEEFSQLPVEEEI